MKVLFKYNPFPDTVISGFPVIVETVIPVVVIPNAYKLEISRSPLVPVKTLLVSIASGINVNLPVTLDKPKNPF